MRALQDSGAMPRTVTLQTLSNCVMGHLNPSTYPGRPRVSVLLQYFKRPWVSRRGCAQGGAADVWWGAACLAGGVGGAVSCCDGTAACGQQCCGTCPSQHSRLCPYPAPLSRPPSCPSQIIDQMVDAVQACQYVAPLELVVNVDHPGDAEQWAAAVTRTRGFVVPVFSNNVHEIRAYNRLAAVARGKVGGAAGPGLWRR
jgi:hypothetical protein